MQIYTDFTKSSGLDLMNLKNNIFMFYINKLTFTRVNISVYTMYKQITMKIDFDAACCVHVEPHVAQGFRFSRVIDSRTSNLYNPLCEN